MGLRLPRIRMPRPIKRFLYGAYERTLLRTIRRLPVPSHVGFIMDGNRRHAKAGGRLPWEGHTEGSNTVELISEWGREVGVRTMTLYAFSTENFERDQQEVDMLMALFAHKLGDMAEDPRVLGNQIRVKVFGRTELLPQDVLDAIDKVETATRDFDAYRLNFCIAYSGRQEIVDAFRRLIPKVQSGELTPECVNEEVLGQHLYTGGDDPDLIIRTGGEARLSNFLLWQSAYSELFFTDVYFPSFRRLDFFRIIRAYQQRQRRFGR